MNLALIVLPGLVLGLGFALVIAALVPTQPSLSAALDRIGTTTVAADPAYAATLENRWAQPSSVASATAPLSRSPPAICA
ncbi:hypothetical protein AB1285_27170 [Microbacterium sp. NRRL B-14842]|uniref:hypothetical protein n=1 Tax=Microbacterium sp. NRRL B-14842 TaxID=3162881 RepID=UPI003D2CA615